ncbi:MAG: preprotein translocase subunit SecE [bacterium]
MADQNDKNALKEKLKQEKKELKKARKLEKQRLLEEQEDKNPLKFKEWCSIEGIRSEIKEVNWLTVPQLAKDSAVVLVFTFVLGIYFYGADVVIAMILKALGMN